MALKKKHEEHENHERWLVSYADFITLLFAFFVVMYSVSSLNEGKYKTVSESLINAFTNHQPIGRLSVIELPLEQRKEIIVKNPPKIKENIRTYVQIANAIQTVKVPDGVMVKSTRRGLNIRIKEDALFDSGSASLRRDMKEFLDLVANLIKPLPNLVSIEGHTDSQPIHTVAFPSNWDLSASRATALVRYFTEVHDLNPERFSATSFAGYRPLEANNTPQGRAANRRVEIVILRDDRVRPVQRNPFLP